ncbi:MAG TPA: Ig-like domain-containing protein [Gemmatimonadaceae bacterium]|nr:Ig-like domain-containing protein [Gemmatimonadaceae bacterium]
MQHSAHAQTLDSTGVRAVPTYEAVGLYWDNANANSNGCNVQYRVQGTSTWSNALNLWFDPATNQCRGSIVYLTPGTAYEAQMGVNGAFTKGITFTTWSNSVPVAQTIKVPSGATTLNITAGGSPSGYVLYDGTGSTLDVQNNAATDINITASYVIVRGFTLKGAQQHGILIDKNQHDVIIEDNDISGWGRTRDGTWGTDMDSGIRAVCVNEELTRVTIQRNKIHDPRYPANSWAVAHPAGPQGITFSYCGGNNVYRWNEIYSSQNHFNDGMGGEDNFSTAGFPNKDSDVYGNRVEMTWDDGLEIEGGDENVRVWGNYVNRTGTGISSTIDSVGPLYIFRNVWNRNQFIEGAANDSDQRQPMFKDGSSSSFGNGRRYLFHNTMLQAQCSGCQYGMGGGAGIGGTGDTQLVMNTVSMNNIYDLWKPQNGAFYQIGSDAQFTNDMTNSPSSPEVGGIVATPQYASGNGWVSESGGMYQLAAGTPGYDQGKRIANFNDHFNGAAPDVGAAEAGDAAMKFGIAAASATPDTQGTGTTSTGSTGGTGSTGSTGGSTGTGGTTGGTTGTGTSTGTAAVSATMDSTAYVSNAGQSVTFTAAVMGNSGTPTGSVKFQDNGSTLSACAAVTLSNGKALCTTSSLSGGTHAITGAYSGDATYGAGVAGPITQTVNGSATSSGSAGTSQAGGGALVNMSTRAQVATGAGVMIGGFVIGGSTSKTVVVTATGPSLANFGIANALANPTLTLVRSSDQSVVATNVGWRSAANAAQIQASGFAPSDPRESAILVTLPPGAYTAIVSGANGSTGVGMVAAYEVDHPESPLINLATRGEVLTGNDVMIGGFIVQGSGPQTVVVTATGPSLAQYGVANPLANPTLTIVRSSDQSVVASNDDWQSGPNAAQIQAKGLAPSNAKESAVMMTLQPGAYTAIVSGAANSTGVGVIGVYAAQ